MAFQGCNKQLSVFTELFFCLERRIQLIRSRSERDIAGLPPEQRNVGYVPQHPALFQHLTVKEKILPNFRKVLKELQVPVLYVTHDPKEAELLADNYAIMDNGQIRQVNTAAEAFEIIRPSIFQRDA